QVRAADNAPRDVVLRQVAPGRYESRLVADATLPLAVTLESAGRIETTGVGSRVVLPDPAAEFRFGPPDEERLHAIATATGGAWRPGPEALATAAGDRRIDRRPIWPVLVAIALGLWFLDILLRRIRLFEPSVARSTV